MSNALTGTGRSELEALVSTLRSKINEQEQELVVTRGQREGYLRELERRGKTPWLLDVLAALEAARAKHPAGTLGVLSLAEEVGELASAIRREGPDRQKAEAMDVAVVALRIWMGEVAS